MKEGLAGVDIVMMLRLQLERMAGAFVPSTREYFRFYGLDREKLAYAKPGALVMHPGPMNRGVEIDSVIADDIEVSVIQEQVEMGVAIRMAVLDALARGLRQARTQRAMTRTAFINARLLDPATGLDAPGAIAGRRRDHRRFRSAPLPRCQARPMRGSSIAKAARLRRA